MPNPIKRLFTTILLALLYSISFNTFAQANQAAKTNTVVIQDAWARATHPGQKVGAVYMTLTSPQDTTLIKIESDVTESVEIHSMSMQNGVMKMRMLEKLQLTANKPYKLAPGGYHLMLFDLKKPLFEEEQLNLILHFTNKHNVEYQQKIKVPVKSAEIANDEKAHQHHH
jgi:copper(I)-binding protein